MKEVVIHIGTHKTGSTSIQSALFGYKAKKTKYASFHTANHSIPFIYIFSDPNKHFSTSHVYKEHQKKNKKLFKQVLKNDLLDTSYNRLIISGEVISIFSEKEKILLIRYLKLFKLKITLCLYIRDLVEYCRSYNCQVISSGYPHFLQLNLLYKAMLETFIKLLPKKNIAVFNYNEIKKSQSVVKHFAQSYNLALSESKKETHVNKSLTLPALALVYKLNQSTLTHLVQEPLVKKVHKEIKEKIENHFNNEDKVPNDFFYHLLPMHFQKDLRWLNTEFNISFNNKKIKSDQDILLKALDDSIKKYFNKIKEFFHNLNTPYDLNLNLEANLRVLFLNTLVLETKDKSIIFTEIDADFFRDIALKIHHNVKITDQEKTKIMGYAYKIKQNGEFIKKTYLEWNNK